MSQLSCGPGRDGKPAAPVTVIAVELKRKDEQENKDDRVIVAIG